MRTSLKQTISRRDVGFIVAKILALCAWRISLQELAISLSTIISNFRIGWTWWYATSNLLPYVAVALVCFYIGVRLWVEAEKFGATPEPDLDSSSVLISREMLLQGLTYGAAIWMLIPLVPMLATLLESMANSHHGALTDREIIDGLLRIILGIFLLGWASKLNKSFEETPFE